MKSSHSYRTAVKSDFEVWLKLCKALWPEYPHGDFVTLFKDILSSPRQAAFLYFDKNEAIAFANVSLRIDYVEGSNSSPVGYLEGIYVDPAYRKQGIAQKLVRVSEQWAKKKGAKEMASDTELRNKKSQQFHQSIGFTKAETIVHFIKKIR